MSKKLDVAQGYVPGTLTLVVWPLGARGTVEEKLAAARRTCIIIVPDNDPVVQRKEWGSLQVCRPDEDDHRMVSIEMGLDLLNRAKPSALGCEAVPVEGRDDAARQGSADPWHAP